MSKPVPGLALEDQPEHVLFRMCLWAEARGEKDVEGRLESVAMLAIAHVILTRAKLRHKTAKEIILAPWQFSWTNVGDPNRTKVLTADTSDPIGWERADTVCDLVESGLTLDPTKGADHYYNSKVVTPAWGRGHAQWVETGVIGNHIFGICP